MTTNSSILFSRYNEYWRQLRKIWNLIKVGYQIGPKILDLIEVGYQTDPKILELMLALHTNSQKLAFVSFRF